MLRKVTVENGILQGIPCGDPRVTVFKGVPFAKAPVGNLRWKAPEPAENWTGVRMADTFGNMPLQDQPGLDWTGFYNKELHPTAYDYPMSEDCLYLNVWTPALSTAEKLPVFFFIHGGAYTAGYSYEMEFDGERVARKGCIFVTAGYRLGAMGFFAHKDLDAESPGASQGNFAFLDQLAGIKWVKRNIAAFGGDPDRITIAGQSAGAGSVFALICSPLSAGLIKGAVCMSGGGISEANTMASPLEDAQAAGAELLKVLNVKSVEEARRLPGKVVCATYLGMRNRMRVRKPPIVIDGVFMKENPLDIVLNNKLPDISFLIGCCHDEGYNFGAMAQNQPATPEAFEKQAREEYGKHADRYLELANVRNSEDIKKLLRSEEYHGFALRQNVCMDLLVKQKRPVYAYIFDHDVPGDDGAGSYHSSDLWFVFDSLNRNWRPFKGEHYDLARQVCTYWVNFVRSGDPNGIDHDGSALPQWDKYTADSPMRMKFGKVPGQYKEAPKSDLFKLRMDKVLGKLEP